MDEKLKIALGLAIIVVSFYYVVKSKRPMLDNLIHKSKEKYQQEFKQQQAIKDAARAVVDGKADAFDTITKGVKAATKPAADMVKENHPVNKVNAAAAAAKAEEAQAEEQ